MLYRVLTRMLDRGGEAAADLRPKLDVFFAAGRITATEYATLTARMG